MLTLDVMPAQRDLAGSSIAIVETEEGIVSPPTDAELYSYYGSQKRWVSLVMSVAFLLAALSVYNFSKRSAWLYPFYLVLGINVLGMLISFTSGLNRRRFTLAQHKTLIANWRPASYPSVDVFLPTCGEGMDVLNNTYKHVAALQWPGDLIVWVLDDADRNEVRDAAQRMGFEYVVRPNRGHMKKAGNMLYAYSRSRGDIIAVFDADFCPRPDYLAHLVPYLDDVKTGIVQSPQVFDTDPERMGWLERSAGATQELFYRWVQPSRDAVGAPICVGTNALYRRSALDSMNGFAQIEHSEDVHTGIHLMQQGYQTRYVPVLLAKGLCPDELGPFLNQQYRWCNGSITLLRSGHAQKQPLTLRQRLCFWSGFMYYITTALNVFFVHLPTLVMSVFLPAEVLAPNYTPFVAGLWVYFVLLPRVFNARWRFEVLRVQMAYSFSHAVAITDKLTRRSAGWVPTGAVKVGNNLTRRICRVAFYWLTFATLSSWIAMAIDIPKYGWRNYWPMAVFLAGYTYLAVPLAWGAGRILRREAALRRTLTQAGKHSALDADMELAGRTRPVVLKRVRQEWDAFQAARFRPEPSADAPRNLRAAERRSLHWPEAGAITGALSLGALLASGWVDTMLPWVR